MTTQSRCQARKTVEPDSGTENLFAALDIGSHTTRLLIVRKSGRELIPVRAERSVTRLAEGFQREGALTEEAQKRNIQALREYADLLGRLRVEKVRCGATGVVRRAQNRASALQRIEAQTGIECRILSEREEAALAAKGILSVIDTGAKEPLLFDIGGGSTEFVLPGARGLLACASQPLGAATLSDSFLRDDPPGMEAVNLAAAAARRQIDSARRQLCEEARSSLSPDTLGLAGTAGTITTLAAMKLGLKHYSPYLVNGEILFAEWISSLIGSLARMPLAERRQMEGLEAGREDIILGGAVILQEVLLGFGCDRVVVSDAGLIEGLVIELAQSQSGLPGEGGARPRTDLTWRLPKR